MDKKSFFAEEKIFKSDNSPKTNKPIKGNIKLISYKIETNTKGKNKYIPPISGTESLTFVWCINP